MNRIRYAPALLLLLLACDSAAEPEPLRAAAVSVTPATAELTAVAATVRLAAAVRDQDGQPMPSAIVTWTSGTPAVAAVDGSGLVTAVANGTAAITATAGTVSESATVTVVQRIAAVRIVPDTATLSAVEDTVRLTGRVLDANGHPVAGAAVSWASGDTAVAVVDGSGLVTARRNGAVWIEAAAGSGEIGRAAITVAQVVSTVTVTPAADTLIEADTLRLAAVAADANGHEVDGTLVAWASADTLVAVVDASGLVTGVTVGSVMIGATASGVTGEAEIEVVPPVPSAVSVTPDTVAFSALGDTAVLSVAVLDQVGRLMDSAAVSWASGDTAVAVVDSAGVVTAVAGGATAITATAGVASGSAVVTVAQVAGSVVVTPSADTLELGDTLRLSVAAFDDNGHRVAGAGFEWRSSDTAVARVDEDGLVMGAGEGTAAITATAGDVGGTAEITVVNPDRAALVTLYHAMGGPEWKRNENWLTEAPLGKWYGVVVNEVGRVIRLNLENNALTGPIPPELGNLAALEWLGFYGNALSGSIPSELGNLIALKELWLGSFNLTGEIPSQLGNLAELFVLDLSDNDLTGAIPSELGNLTALSQLNVSDNGLTGPIPSELGHLAELFVLDLSDNDLTGAIPSELGNLAKLSHLDLSDNDLTGTIPRELGNLTWPRTIYLHNNQLTGSIPRELGNLTTLSGLSLYNNRLAGLIPPELGNLTELFSLDLSGNFSLTGSIPPELGNLTRLARLDLGVNALTGPIPEELGSLTKLISLDLQNNHLTGWIPTELGNLSALRWLVLLENELTGPIPPELGRLTALRSLHLAGNSFAGALPRTLMNLSALSYFSADDTGLCAPKYPAFEDWLATFAIEQHLPSWCPDGTAASYLVQSIQSRSRPVPLVAGRDALLRVFLTAPERWGAPVPPVRARFYAGGRGVYTVDITGRPGPLADSVVDEGDLAISANVEIPGDVLRPGLEMVIETAAHPWFGIPRRWPVVGRAVLDVRAVPTMELTIVPFLWTEDPDSSILAPVEGMAADPEGHELLRLPRALLPVSDWSVTAHDPVWVDTRSIDAIYLRTAALRNLEGGSGYWMATMTNTLPARIAGLAEVRGWLSFSRLRGSTIAHELGHNMSLRHAACNNPPGVDPAFPYPGGRIGVWGYDFTANNLVSPNRPDVMSYCGPEWISDYHFTKAMRHRLDREAGAAAAAAFAAPKTRTLLLWGGVDSTGTAAYIDPAFLVDAVPSMPHASGEWSLDGWTEDGREAFGLSFDMPEIPDAPGERSTFVFTVPVTWTGELESIRLHGPGDAYAVLDRTTDNPMTILRDPVSGQVRAFLRRPMAEAMAAGDRADGGRSGLVALFSRGLPR